MKKISEIELLERANLLQSLFNQGLTKKDIKENFPFIGNKWFGLIKQYNIKEYHHCDICKTTKNLKTSKDGINNICISCFNTKKLQNTPKTYLKNGKNKEERKQQKINDKKCKICGTKENLVLYKTKNNTFLKNICKMCYSIKKSNDSLKMWEDKTDEERKHISTKRTTKWKENIDKLTEEERKLKWTGESFKIYRENETLDQYNLRIQNQKQSYQNKTEEEKQIRSDKVSKAWELKSKEEINKRSEVIFKKKIENGTFNNFQVFGYDKKAQDLFWFLHDNILYKDSIKYATINTRDIANPQNNEYKIRVKDISSTNIFRNLDFYLKLNNGYEINIEFDTKYHKKKIIEDLDREKEILIKKPSIIILRVNEKDYVDNKEIVQKELLDIILNIDKNNEFSYANLNKKYLPLFITNNELL